MTGDTKYSELAGDETVMEITLQAQWKEAEPTETPETHRDTGTYRDAGTHRQTESHAEAGQHRKARIRKRHGNGRQRGYRRWQPPGGIRGGSGSWSGSSGRSDGVPQTRKPLKQNKL